MIGDTLRSEREKKGLSIKDIEKATSIRALYIECIEEGRYDELPGEAYTKGFIRNYANYLKLDANALVGQYVSENHPEEVPPEPEAAPQPAPAKRKAPRPAAPAPAQPQRTERQTFTDDDFQRRLNEKSGHGKLIAILIAIVVLAGGAYYVLGSDSDTASKPATKTTQQAKKPAASQSAPAVAPEKQYDDVELTAKFTGNCWTQVKADGKVIFEGTVKKGETKEWKADEKLVVTAGNAGAVSLSVNGQDLGQPGGEGEVVEKTYTKSGEADDSKAQSDKSAKKESGK